MNKNIFLNRNTRLQTPPFSPWLLHTRAQKPPACWDVDFLAEHPRAQMNSSSKGMIDTIYFSMRGGWGTVHHCGLLKTQAHAVRLIYISARVCFSSDNRRIDTYSSTWSAPPPPGYNLQLARNSFFVYVCEFVSLPVRQLCDLQLGPVGHTALGCQTGGGSPPRPWPLHRRMPPLWAERRGAPRRDKRKQPRQTFSLRSRNDHHLINLALVARAVRGVQKPKICNSLPHTSLETTKWKQTAGRLI